MIAVVLTTVFVTLLILEVPVAFAVGLAALAAMILSMDPDIAVTTVAQRVAVGLDSFTLLAIPFFVLSGYLMGEGGLARRLIDAARALVGALPGGLAFANVLSCMVFGSVSGSAVAATSAIGSFMTPEMERAGYQRPFSAAVTVTASTTGLLIPPSNVLIVFAVASGGVSIAALFAAGIVPGIILGLALMFTCFVLAKRKNFPIGETVPLSEVARALLNAVPAIILLVIVIGGILAGIFTATESGGIAVLYTLFLSLVIYRELSLKQLKPVFLKAIETTGVVMLLIGASAAMAWMIAYADIPQTASAILLELSEHPIILILIINVLLLAVGAFLDITPAVLIFTPILLPISLQLGMSPEQFGVMMVLNLSIGLCTPPVGSVLFVGSSIARTSVASIISSLVPFYLAMIVILICVAFLPQLSEALPRSLGLMD